MQSDWKEIYKLTSKRTGKDEQLYKDLGNFVFAELSKSLRRPKSLIIKLKGVGSWYLRKKRIQAIVDMFPPDFDKKDEDFSNPYELLKHENRKEVYLLFKERLEEYKEYSLMRSQIRTERNKTQYLLKPKDDVDM